MATMVVAMARRRFTEDEMMSRDTGRQPWKLGLGRKEGGGKWKSGSARRTNGDVASAIGMTMSSSRAMVCKGENGRKTPKGKRDWCDATGEGRKR